MRSKSEIERTISHLKTDCTAEASVNKAWIAALEWVLGDDEHRNAYQEWLELIEPPRPPWKDYSAREFELLLCLKNAYNRLR